MKVEKYKLKVDLQCPDWFKKGMVFYFEEELGFVYGEEKGIIAEYPLRTNLAGYLFFLKGDYENRFFKLIKE